MTLSKYIVKKRSGVHGFGLFAKTDIPKDTCIIEYVGEKITKAEAQRRGPRLVAYAKKHDQKGAVYLFELNKRYDLDGHVGFNPARYINHSCDPNCEAMIIRGRIWIFALRNIQKGKELFYNYGYDLETYEEHPCLCASAHCPGYIAAEEHWTKIKRLIKKKSI